MKIEFKRIEINDEAIKQLETARYEAYDMKNLEIPCTDSFYARELKTGKYMVYGAYLEEELIGACYITNCLNLYIEQLYIKPKYRSLKIGKQLLLHVLQSKNEIENYFNEKYDYSYLSTRSDELNNYFEKLGYKNVNDIYMKKRL